MRCNDGCKRSYPFPILGATFDATCVSRLPHSSASGSTPSITIKREASFFMVATLTERSPFRPRGYWCDSTTVRERTSSLEIVKSIQRLPLALDEQVGLNPARNSGASNLESP